MLSILTMLKFCCLVKSPRSFIFNSFEGPCIPPPLPPRRERATSDAASRSSIGSLLEDKMLELNQKLVQESHNLGEKLQDNRSERLCDDILDEGTGTCITVVFSILNIYESDILMTLKEKALKKLWEKNKILVISIFSNYHTVFFPYQKQISSFWHLTHSHTMTPFEAPGKQAF